ncbi:MAG: hypothetical protein HQL57_11145, partial [Magnetococcales bacterium]|nr:hypothetical protein [Magnetococcales bacterium]
MMPLARGGNNRLFRVTSSTGERFALKGYGAAPGMAPASPPDAPGDTSSPPPKRDRQGPESSAL